MTNVRATFGRVVADAAKLDRSGIEIGFAVRCTVGVMIPLIVASVADASLAGVSAAYGAIVTGFASRQGVYRTRAVGMLLTAFALALSGFAGATTGAHPVANVVLAGVWAAAFGLAAALGKTATTASINGVVAFVIFSNAPYDTSDPAFQAAMVIAGGVLQTLLLVLVWPLQRFRVERHALATTFRALALYASNVDHDDLGLPEAATLADLRATLADPQPFGSRNELASFEALADEAERIRSTLAALTSDHHLLAEVGLTTASHAIGAVATATASILGVLALAVDAGRSPEIDPSRWDELDRGVRAIEANLTAGAPSIRDARTLAAQLRSAWRAARAAANGGVAASEHVPIVRFELAAVRDALETLRANLSFDSVYARHALRLGVAIPLAIVAQHALPLAHGQWIGLTVALVLRPDFSSTFTRGFARIFGTIAGAVVASAIAVFHPSDLAYIALAIAFAFLSYALFNVSYAVFSAAITGYVVYLLAFGGSPEHAAATDRVLATIAGGVLALLAYVVWPTWARERVADDLAALLRAQARFGSLVMRAFLDPARPDVAAMYDAQLQSRRARSNAEASIDQMKGEPVRVREISLAAAQGVLAASRRIGVASLALRARLDDREPVPRAPLETLIADVDTAMASVAGALAQRTHVPPLPPIRDDQDALARALSAGGSGDQGHVLASETDLYVDSIDVIADIVGRHAP
jgi:uncharacterized membrane protein YccC